MDRHINTQANGIVYPLQRLMLVLVRCMFAIVSLIAPDKYKDRIKTMEKSNTMLNIIGLTFFSGLGGLVLMLTNIKVANVLGASLYGLFSYYLAIGEVGQYFVRYGRHKTMTRDLIQNQCRFDNLTANTFVLGLINIVLVILVVLFLAKPLDITITIASILLILSPCVGSVDFQPVYESLKQMSWHSIYLLIQRFLFLLAFWIYILLIGKPSLVYLGVMLFSSWLIIVLLQYKEIIIGLGIKIRQEVSFGNIWGLYKSNFLIALSCMVGVAFGPALRLILKDYVSSEAVGIYSAGMQIYLISQFLMHQVSRVGNPMMAEAGKTECCLSERRKLVNKYLVIMVGSAMPFVLAMCVFPKIITNFCFTEEYSELSTYLPYFGMFLAALCVGTVFEQFIISMRYDKMYFCIYVAGALLTIGAAFILIPSFGLLGGVLSLVIPGILTRVGYSVVGLYNLYF